MTEIRRRGRVLGLDVGDRRIGVAVSDPDRSFALPLNSIDRKLADEMEAIAAVVRADDVDEIVVGLPLTLSGEAGPQAESTTSFAQALEMRFELPVHLYDERLSTREAIGRVQDGRRGSGGRRERNRPRADTDALAASIILQAYLDGLRMERLDQ